MNEWADPSGAGSEEHEAEDAGSSVEETSAEPAAEIGGTQVPDPGAAANPWDPEQAERRLRRARSRNSAKALLAIALAGIIAFGFWPRGNVDSPLNTSPADTDTYAPWTIAAVDPEASDSPAPTFADPDDAYFADSPALDWADNAAGFTVPKAAALNGVSRSDIAAGYQELEKVMETGNLDTTILDGGSIHDFTKLLNPATTAAKDLPSWISHPSFRDDPTLLVTRFNPATTRLLGHTIKVQGSMSAKDGPHHYTVALTADYVFVYAVGPVADTLAEQTRVTVHRTVQLEVVNPAYYESVAGKAWLLAYAASNANIECYKYDGYIEPGFVGAIAPPNQSGYADPYATGNLLTSSPQPSSTATQGNCQAASDY